MSEESGPAEWHPAMKNTVRWVVTLVTVLAVGIVGIFFLMNPQYENPRNPFHAGPVLVIAAILGFFLPLGVSMLDLVAVRYSSTELVLKLRTGRIIHVPWSDVGDCRYDPETKGLTLALLTRPFGWRARFEEPIGDAIVLQLKDARLAPPNLTP